MASANFVFAALWMGCLTHALRGTWSAAGADARTFVALTRARRAAEHRWFRFSRAITAAMLLFVVGWAPFVLRARWERYAAEPWRAVVGFGVALLIDVATLVQKYGDPMTIPVVGAGPMVLTWEPAGVEAVFKEDPETFVPALPEGAAVIAGEASVFMTSGERHKRVRKMLMPSFHGERMRAYGTLMRDATLRWTAAWEAGRPFRFLDTTQAVTLDVIIEAIFGVRDSERMRRFHAQIVATIGSFNPLVMVFAARRHDFLGLGPWARFRRDYDAIRAMVFEEIAARRADPAGRSDVLSMLVAARRAGRRLRRPGDLRAALHPRARRPRDRRGLDRVGVRPRAPPPRRPRAAARRARAARPRRRHPPALPPERWSQLAQPACRLGVPRDGASPQAITRPT